MVNNQELLNTTLSRTKAIYSFLKNICAENADAFSGNKILMQGFSSFFKIAESTIYRLEHPVLSIAMVGTTSAGKSTIVNSLMGRRIAPMEPKEMSAGVLKLINSNVRSITVHPTQGALWASGSQSDIEDQEIYDRIKTIFEKYQGNERKCSAPLIDVTGPIEWKQNKKVLDLPDNLDIEFIDLPGLKTVNDPKNLGIIQSILSKAFCVVAMDFNDVDPSRIGRLLEEVKDIVKAANDNTDFLLFALNKVDDVKADQMTAEDKISELKGFIKKTLNLSQEKEVFPFVGQLYYLIQMAVQKDPDSHEIIGYDRENIWKIFKDCSNFFEQQLDLNNISDEEYDDIQKIKQSIRRNKEIDIDLIRNFYNLCYRISKAELLFEEIRRRINESFAQIVIRPTLDEFNKSLVKLLGDLDVYIKINKNSSVLDLISDKVGILKSKLFIEGSEREDLFLQFSQEVEEILSVLESIENTNMDEDTFVLIYRIKKDIRKIQEIISKRTKGYIDLEIDSINSAINEIATKLGTLKSSREIVSYLQAQRDNRVISVFNGMTDVPASVKRTLISCLDNFRYFLASKMKVGEFVEKMNSRLPKGILEELKIPYEILYTLFYETLWAFTKGSTDYSLTTRVSYSDSWKNNVVQSFKQADRRVRDVLSRLTGLAFQKETHTLVGSIQKYLDSELNNILTALKQNTKIQSGDISTLLKNALDVSKAPISLPDEIFTFSSPYQYTNTKSTYAGSVIVGYKEHSCSSDDPIYESVYKDEYTYKYDNEVGCYTRWVLGIDTSEMVFWAIINGWLKEQVTNYMETIKEKSKEVTSMVDSFLDERYKVIKTKQEDRIASLNSLSNKVSDIREHQAFLNCYDD